MVVVTPLGHDTDIFCNNLLEGASGISEIETFDFAAYPTRIEGEIKSFSTDGWVAPKLSKRMDKFMLYLLTAGKKTLENVVMSEGIMSQMDKTKCGVLIGSAMGRMKGLYDVIEALRVSYWKNESTIYNHKYRLCNACDGSRLDRLCNAYDGSRLDGPKLFNFNCLCYEQLLFSECCNHIIRGEAKVMFCGGSDAAIIPIGLGGFIACRVLSQRNNDPSKASRPWDIECDGFVIGERAGALLLEELEHTKQRGANILAEFLGGSFTCDMYHMTELHPLGTGISLCVKKVLTQSGMAREDVNYINAHTTSTPAGDLKEYQAPIRCFSQNPELKVNSTKSMIGHL